MKEVKLDYVIIVYREPILYRRYLRSVILDAKEVLECTQITNELTGNKPHLAFTDTLMQINLTPEAHKISIELQKQSKSVAQAVLVKWVGQRLVVNTFMEISRPPYPVRAFTSEKEGEKWLMKQWEKFKNKS